MAFYKRLPFIFVLALTLSEILKFSISYLQKISQGHRVQFLQGCHSMTNVKIYKSRPMHFFALARAISEILRFQIFDIQKVGQGHWRTIFT